jgi:glycosyltransferase involved in cell wall biosynthesis
MNALLVFVIESTSGGSKRHVIDALEELSRRGHDCALFYATMRQDARFPAEIARLKELGVRCIRLEMTRHFSKHDLRAVCRLASEVKHLARPGQPVVLHGNSSKGGMVVRAAKLLLQGQGWQAAAVYTPHSPITMDPTLGRLKRFVFLTAECVMGLFTNRIIAVSPDERDHVAAWPFCREKTLIVYNGVNMAEAALEAPGERAMPFDFLFVGRLSHQKHPLYALEIIRRIDGSSLTIVGDGELQEDVKRYIEQYGLTERVKLVGFSSMVDEYYRRHGNLLLSSRYEGFPYVVLEAMANGCAIIGTEVPGLNGILQETGNVRIPLDDAARAAEIIKERFSNAAAVERLQAANRMTVRTRFSLEQMADGLEQVYRSVVKEK